MKTYIKIAFASFVAMAALAACQQKETEPVEWKTNLQVVSSDLIFTPLGGTGTFVLNESGASVSSGSSWCQASVSGTTVNVTVDEWGGLESRYALLTVTKGGETLDVSVVQSGVNLSGVVIDPELVVDGAGGTATYPCSSNASITVSSSADWIVASLEEGNLVITTTPNPDKATRIGTLSIYVGNVLNTVTVLQYPVFEKTPDWVVGYGGVQTSGGVEYSVITNTVSADHGLYTVTVSTPVEIAASGLSEADYVAKVLAPSVAADINAAVEYYGGQYPFSMFLLSGSDWDYVQRLNDGNYVGFAIGYDEQGYPTGWYGAAEFEVGKLSPYQMWLGQWNVPRGDDVDVWVVEENEPDKSYWVSGIGGMDPNRFATGAFKGLVEFDAATGEMVFKVWENTSVSWQDTSRGTMNGLLSGMYTNVAGKTYYSAKVGTVIMRAKISSDGLSAEFVPDSVTSSGAPATFHVIKWYGRYTKSDGSRSGVSWTGMEQPIPITATKKQ